MQEPMKIPASCIAQYLKSTWQTADTAIKLAQDAYFNTVSIDTRTLSPGALFIALPGPRFDGHNFIQQAKRAGACACIVRRDRMDAGWLVPDLPYLTVTDTYAALITLAAAWRERYTLPIIAITGSCGKTSTKTMLGSVLSTVAPTFVSTGNFNNHIGVPLSVLRLGVFHRFGVLELGASHAGEIAQLVQCCKPNIAIITNAAAVHIEGFGSQQGVVAAKAEILQGLAPKGTAVLNADSPYIDQWSRCLQPMHRLVRFGVNCRNAEIRAVEVNMDAQGHPQFQLIMPQQPTVSVQLSLLGKHQVYNALAAAAAAYAVGVDAATIRLGLEQALPVKGRLRALMNDHGVRVLDDTYNASPFSLHAALQVLALYPNPRILVLGDMKELGQQQERALHREMGEKARAMALDAVYTYGVLTKATAAAFGNNAHHFFDRQKLICALRAGLSVGATVLVKGSRSMGMEHVVQALLGSASAGI